MNDLMSARMFDRLRNDELARWLDNDANEMNGEPGRNNHVAAVRAAAERLRSTEEMVTTVEDLDALPRASVILFITPIQTAVAQKSVHDGLWYFAGSATSALPGFPARVLYRPVTEGGDR